MSAPSPDTEDEGFITPTFAGLSLAMLLVGAAFLLAARQDLATARTASSRQAEQLRLEGVAATAALRILASPGQDRLAWRDGGEIVAEPEGRKINPVFATRTENQPVVGRLVGPAEARSVSETLAAGIAALPRLARRQDMLAVSRDPRWRDCAASVFSVYSQQTALTLAPSQDLGRPSHAGEIWRIVAAGPTDAWIDQTVRLTGAPARPVDILEQSGGASGGAARVACRRLIEQAETRHGQG